MATQKSTSRASALHSARHSATHAPLARTFARAESDLIRAKIGGALGICRIVRLATRALDDGALSFEDSTSARWHPSIAVGCEHIYEVRSILLESAGAPPLDWWTPLNLLEALDAAMWHANPASGAGELDADDFAGVLDAVVDALHHLATSHYGQVDVPARH